MIAPIDLVLFATPYHDQAKSEAEAYVAEWRISPDDVKIVKREEMVCVVVVAPFELGVVA